MPRRSPGWPTSPASNCIRIRCAPRISTTRTSCASTSIRFPASRGSRSAAWRARWRRRSPTSDCAAGRRPRARAVCTSTCGSNGAGRSPRCGAPRWRSRARSSGGRPTMATSKWWKEERQGVFLDYNQNAKDRTVAGAYSVRPTPDARVSAPLTWDEVPSCDPHDFTLATMPRRFAEAGDVQAGDRRARVFDRAAARARRTARARRARRRAVAAALPQAGRRAGARRAVAPAAARSTR